MNLPTTEQRNPVSDRIDTKSTLEILSIINGEDRKVPLAVASAIGEIAALVDSVVEAFHAGGRLIYIGAGTSGRLGVLDASECPPTYGVSPEMVQGIIAGGTKALTRSVENAEDDPEAGVQALRDIGFCPRDVLVGITASGQAPFVLGALRYAKDLGAAVAAISCNQDSATFQHARFRIYLPVGPEIVAGSTRMKAGTAQKLTLNMITTASMIRIGKVYNNLMVDLIPLNHKLVLRSKRLVMEATGCGPEEAEAFYERSGRKPKTAILMALLGVEREEAERLLETGGGSINRAIAARGPAR